ncbi:hypothetical protein [Egicoccus halophilus]|uniref:Uncharacterized protein n=1 Tax=Egicoccus halophilus TaxID=1670830 RepID=A0A8J3ETA9_9ACTN|nr:hypothetical protein [Egicoccus halophilus]GGI03556.1 hypothetical protein GCM10011354_04620 [Egicoccus halophilus]
MTLSPTTVDERASYPLAVIGAGLLLNGTLFGLPWLFDGAERFSETAGLWQYAAFHRVQLVLLIALVLVLPRWRGAGGVAGTRTLGATLLGAVVAACVLKAGSVFAMAFVAPFLAQVAPAALDVENGGTFMLAMIAADVVFLAATVALGITAFRARAFPRPAAVAVVLGGLLTPMFGPLAGVLVGVGLAWAGWAAGRAATRPAAPLAHTSA